MHGMWDPSSPWPGMQPESPAVEVQSLNHRTAREVPQMLFLYLKNLTVIL